MEGNALLLFPEEGIRELERMLLGSSGQAGDDLRLSAFAEIGNILTGTLLTVLSSLSERIVVSLPPLLVQDMAGAILDTILAEVGTRSDEVTALVFQLTGPEGANLVRSVLIPGSAGIELFLEAAVRLRTGQ
jgi:chemotaxis protein CheC